MKLPLNSANSKQVPFGHTVAMASKEEQEDEQMAPKPESEQVPSASKTESEAGPAAMLVEATADAALLQQLDTELLRVCDLLLDHHGGPVQYLQSELGAEPNAAWTACAADLERHFPRRPDLTYVDGLQYPPGCQGQASAIKLSLWQLGWHPDCSSKPPTFKPAAWKLVDEFLTHSFITASDNLLLYQSESYPGRMENQQDAPIFVYSLCQRSDTCQHNSDFGTCLSVQDGP